MSGFGQLNVKNWSYEISKVAILNYKLPTSWAKSSIQKYLLRKKKYL